MVKGKTLYAFLEWSPWCVYPWMLVYEKKGQLKVVLDRVWGF